VRASPLGRLAPVTRFSTVLAAGRLPLVHGDWLGVCVAEGHLDNRGVRAFLSAINEVLGAEADVARNEPDEGGCHIAPAVIRYRGRAPVRVSELLVGTALPDLYEAESGQDGDDDART
jgi:hypothetical protein